MLVIDIGYQTSGERYLPRFEALVEVKPLHHACLILIMSEKDYNQVVERLRGGVLVERQGF
jgi:hypothetical protein